MDDYQKFLAYTSRVFSKTAEALPASSENPYIREKVASSIDRDKVAAMEYLVKCANPGIISRSLSALNTPLGRKIGLTGALGAGAYFLAPKAAYAVGHSTARGAAAASEEKVKEVALKYLLPVAAVIGLGATAKSGLLGDKAQSATTSVTDTIGNLLSKLVEKKTEGSNKPEEKVPSTPKKPGTHPGSDAYKVAAAKTLYSLSLARESCDSPRDLEKISAAHDECAQILFDCIFYL